MREQGVVARILPPDAVEVSLKATEACGRCGACHPAPEGRVCIEAAGISGLKPGDEVEIDIPTGEVVRTGFIVYLLPVIFLIAGYGFGNLLARFLPGGMSGEAGGIGGALVLCAVSFGIIRRYDREARKKGMLRAKVVRILPKP